MTPNRKLQQLRDLGQRLWLNTPTVDARPASPLAMTISLREIMVRPLPVHRSDSHFF